MTELTTEFYRTLISDLSTAQTGRLRTLAELAAFDAEETRVRPREVEQELADAERACADAKAQLDDWHARRLAQIDEDFRSRDATVRLKFNRTMGEVDLAEESARSAAEQKYKDNCWLLQSVLDDTSESSPKTQYERLQSQLEKSLSQFTALDDEIRSLTDAARTYVESCWQRFEAPAQASINPHDRMETEQAVLVAAESVRLQSARLRATLLPKLFSRWLALIPIVLLVAGGLFAAAYFSIKPAHLGLSNFPPDQWALIVGGATAGSILIALIVLWNVASRQIGHAIEPLAQSAVDVVQGIAAWRRFADEDLRRAEHDYRVRYQAQVERRERSLAQFAAEYEGKLADLSLQRTRSLALATGERDDALRGVNEDHRRQRFEQTSAYESALRTLSDGWLQQRRQIADAHASRTQVRAAERRSLQDRSDIRWKLALRQLTDAVARGESSRPLQLCDWNLITDPGWRAATDIPDGIRIGEYRVRIAADTQAFTDSQQAELPAFNLPALLPFPDAPSLLIKASDAGRREAVALLQSAMLRLLAQLPPGDLRFTIVDPVGLGENFSAFMHLADFDELLVTNRIWTEPAQIEDQLAKITEHMENVFQKYLRNEFESLEEYNHHAGEVAEPYRILVVADFPAGFTERAAQRLASIASSGPRCGVFTLVSVDRAQPLPRDFDMSRLEADATILEWSDAEFVNPQLGSAATLIRDELPSATQFAAVIRKLGELSKDVRRVEVPFHRIAPHPEAYWTADSRNGIDVPLGRAGATKLQHLRLGSGTSQHVLIAGKTGSGKSTLLHVVVTDLALRYSPDEVEFYLIDFKKGVEFKTYASHKLPHARVIAIESDREFGASVLERLDAVLKERGDLFREAGAQDIKSFRDARPDVKMPRILLIVDEFQEFFVEDDKHSQTAALLLDRLVRQGRAFGIHVLLGSQTLGGAYSLARTTLGQMAVRIALQCSEADAHLILSENNSAARLLTRPGEAIYNDANGLMEGNHPFQVAWLDDGQRDEFLTRIETLVDESQRRWPAAVVFEGNRPTDPMTNDEYSKLLPIHSANRQATGEPRIWIGEAVAITGPTEVRFAARAGANLLIVGQDPSGAAGILNHAVIALAAQGSRVELLAERLEQWSALAERLSPAMHISSTSETALAEFAAEAARRQESRESSPPWCLVIDDLSRFRELRKSDDDFGFSSFDKSKTASPGQTFGETLKDGPAVGMHVIVWCDSYNNVDRWFSRQMLREFETRVVFQMAANDSSNLIDSPAAAKLGNNRAILYADERGTMEKFRPYGPVTDEWLVQLNPGSSSNRDSSTVDEADEGSRADQSLSPASESKAWPTHPLETTSSKRTEPPSADAEVPEDLSAWTVS